ncbi:MAG: radical SAM protein [Tepidisphaeraceae bacterium]|jgi:MoaA/NifB/PqqE/SkfB family radical SAM enzyme
MGLMNYQNYGRLWRVYGLSLLRYSSVRKIVNAIRTEYAYRRRITDVRSAPFILFLEPLYYCNLDCPLCDRQVFPLARRGDAGKLSIELYDRILDEVGDYLFQCQIFGQGEPLLDWPLTRKIIEHSHRRRIFTLMSTNCTLIRPANAAEMVSCGLDHLVCAIDGISQSSYEVYRTGGRYEDAMGGLEMVLAERRKQRSRTYVEWQFLVHAHNVHEVDAAQKLADKLGVYIRFSPLRGMEWNADLESYWLPNTGRLDSDIRLDSDMTSKIEPRYNWPCYFLWRSLVLNSNGKAARCLIYQNVSQYANLHEQSVMEAFNDPSVQRARQLFTRGPVPDGEFPSPCNNCAHYARHHGGEYLGKRDAVRRPLPILQSA